MWHLVQLACLAFLCGVPPAFTVPRDATCVFDKRLRGECRGTYEADFLQEAHLKLAPLWQARARAAITFLGTSTRRVLDYGSGTGYLRTLLPPGVAYHAVDIRNHSECVLARVQVDFDRCCSIVNETHGIRGTCVRS